MKIKFNAQIKDVDGHYRYQSDVISRTVEEAQKVVERAIEDDWIYGVSLIIVVTATVSME